MAQLSVREHIPVISPSGSDGCLATMADRGTEVSFLSILHHHHALLILLAVSHTPPCSCSHSDHKVSHIFSLSVQ